MNTFVPDAEMLRNYVQRKLSPESEEQVELWLAENPSAIEELEFDLALQEAMPEARDPTPREARVAIPFWLAWLTRPTFAGAVAIALLAAIVTPTALFLAAEARNQGLVARIAQLEPGSGDLASVTIVELSASRGGDKVDAVVRPNEGDAYVVFRVFVSDPSFTSYRVRLIDESSLDKTLPGLQLNYDDALEVGHDAAQIHGRLRLVVYGQRSDDIVEIDDYLIDLR